jgi:hypothetical protein
VKHTLPEKRKTCPTITLSFDEFQLVDLAFDLSVGMDKRESSKHSLLVSL